MDKRILRKKFQKLYIIASQDVKKCKCDNPEDNGCHCGSFEASCRVGSATKEIDDLLKANRKTVLKALGVSV